MKLKKTLGAILIASPFIALAYLTLIQHGIEGVFFVFGICALIVGVLYFGVKLFMDNF